MISGGHGKIPSAATAMVRTVVLLLLVPTYASAGHIDLGDGDIELLRIGHSIDILEDPEGLLTIEQVKHSSASFIPALTDSINLGFDQSIYWLRVSLNNTIKTSRPLLVRVDYAFFDDIQLYAFDGDRQLHHYRTGDFFPYSERPILEREFIFPLDLPAQTKVDLFLRIQCNESKQIPVDLLSPSPFQTSTAHRFAIYGALFGSMGIMIFYNLFIWALARERSYLWYTAYVASTSFYHFAFTGLGFQYLWPHSTTWQNYCLPILGCIAVIMLVGFTRSYLTTRTRSPQSDLTLQIFLVLTTVATLISLFITAQVAMLVHAASIPLGIGIVLWSAVSVGLKRYPPALYFLVSFIIVALSYVYASVAVTTMFPMAFHNSDLITFILPVTFVVEVVLISFGLAHKIRTLRAEKEVAMQIQLMESERLALLGESARRFVPYEFLQCLDKHDLFEIELGDHTQREMTILFCDIRSFTTLAESLTPAETFQFINHYLGLMGPVIRSHHGFIDKFIGDAIMALFPGGPDDALRCALEMDRALQRYNDHALRLTPDIKIGIGIHTGTLILGTVGDELRLQGTVISDAVNVASRIESLTKTHASVALLSDASYSKLTHADRFNLTEVGPVELRGKSRAVTLFALHDQKTP
ncbi:MAG: 7TM diverse intracellular signaling domain-containing protein [Myxococcota bacterium]|nr:7TM diverse intracellular signaling domain-containing protein [Myxococcota bacterium]